MTKDIVPAIKQRLTLPLPGKYMQMQMAPTFRPDINNQQTSVKAGVMILLYPNPTELHVVLMKRPEYPGTHSGQISFPGGKFEANDENLIKTALRETEEEIGVLSSNVMVLGQLTPLYIPASEFEVYPTVGFIDKPQFIIDPQEVEYVIEAEANFLLRPDTKGVKRFSNNQYTRRYPVLQYKWQPRMGCHSYDFKRISGDCQRHSTITIATPI